MKLIIYTLNSFGGNYDYAIQLQKTYLAHPLVESCILVLPINSPAPPSDNVLKILKSDKTSFHNTILKKIYFLYRSIVNPFRLFRLIRKSPGAVIIFNDFDQITSLLWQPFFKTLRNRFLYAIILHDPDRDRYLGLEWLSRISMSKVMSMMDLAFFHGSLPDKTYYRGKFQKLQVPHGIYPPAIPDLILFNELIEKKDTSSLLGILGNIRDEKNYAIIIRALVQLPDVMLLIAGHPANSQVPIMEYRRLIASLGLNDRVIWIDKYLSESEMGSVINACDIISLYYRDTFTSQSGILNTVAPYRKPVIVSEIKSALTETVRQYRLGKIVPSNNIDLFVAGVRELIQNGADSYHDAWDSYSTKNGWQEHVTVAVQAFTKKKNSSYAN